MEASSAASHSSSSLSRPRSAGANVITATTSERRNSRHVSGEAKKDRKDDTPYAVTQSQDRALAILKDYQLLMRYAVVNDTSISQMRYYLEQIAGGARPEPESIVKYWMPLSES